MYQSKCICNFVFKYYTPFIYFCDFIFSSLKYSGWDQGIGFISILIILFCYFLWLLVTLILQIQALIHQGALAREWLYQEVYLHCGKSAWSSSLLMVSQCHLHTGKIILALFYIFSVIKQLFGLNFFCETLLVFWGQQRLRWLNDITDSRDLKVKVAQSCGTLQLHGLYNPWNSPGQNAGVGSYSLLQGIVPIQGLNPGLPHRQADSFPGKPPVKSQWIWVWANSWRWWRTGKPSMLQSMKLQSWTWLSD